MVADSQTSEVRSLDLMVVIPALNEEETITEVIRGIPRSISGIGRIRTLVVDDGSTDRTAELARKCGAEVLSFPRNRGVGAAFHRGVQYALDHGADIMVNMDGDGQFSPSDIPALVEPLLNRSSDMVTASRFIDRNLWPRMTKVKFYGNRAMAALVSLLVGKKFFDVSCGFRAYTRDVLLQMNLFGQFTYTQETFLDLSFKGIEIREVPIRVRGVREFGQSRVASNLFRYGIQTVKIIFRSFRDYKPMILFGGISVAFLFLSFALSTFLFVHFFQSGSFTPHKWAGFTAGMFFGLGAIVFVTGLLADMLGRVRRNQERILYIMKKTAKDNDCFDETGC